MMISYPFQINRKLITWIENPTKFYFFYTTSVKVLIWLFKFAKLSVWINETSKFEKRKKMAKTFHAKRVLDDGSLIDPVKIFIRSVLNLCVVTTCAVLYFFCGKTLKDSAHIDRKFLLTTAFFAILVAWICLVFPHVTFSDYAR